MKINFLIILLIVPICLIGQKKRSSVYKPELWITGGIMPLQKGMALYGKAQFNADKNGGINLSFGYGFANPAPGHYDLSNIHTQGSFISGGLFFKTADYKRAKQRKLILLGTLSLVFGQGKESAQYHFKGNDFGDYNPSETYKQKYDFGDLQLAIGATYRINGMWNIEISTYATTSKKNRLGTQYFKVNENYAYAYNGIIGANIGVGYLLWKPKSKK